MKKLRHTAIKLQRAAELVRRVAEGRFSRCRDAENLFLQPSAYRATALRSRL